MCLILIAYRLHPGYEIIVAANRDEFYNRPTQPAEFWADHPDVLAGRDLQAGGTWLGVSRSGRFAAVTNYREAKIEKAGAPSRGQLIRDFLISNTSPESYLEKLQFTGAQYNGFNVVFGDANELFYFSNRSELSQRLSPGVHGLSNHTLNTPWPKVEKGKKRFTEILAEKEMQAEKIFELLRDTSKPDDALLPDTGVGAELERTLSPIFISSPRYGTRSSTILLMDKKKAVTFIERNFEDQQVKTVRYEFEIENSKLKIENV